MSDRNGNPVETVMGPVTITPHQCAYDFCPECAELRDEGWRQLEAAEAEVARLRTALEAEIERCDPDVVDRDCWPAGWLNFRRKGWLDGVKITRAVVRDNLRAALAAETAQEGTQ